MRDAWDSPEFAGRWDARDNLATNPGRPRQLGLLVALVDGACSRGARVLDLGIGSGLVEELLLAARPDLRVTGVDASPAMLDLARERFARAGAHVELVEKEFADLDEPAAHGAPFDCAICVQALHEVTHEVKQRVFAYARRALRPGGAFYVLDRFTYAADRFGRDYAAIWHKLSGILPESERLDFEDYHRRYSAKTDHVACLDDYLAWLAAAGFERTCLHQEFNRALIAAHSAPGAGSD